MATEKELNDKWNELLDYAKQHATGKGLHTGFRWTEDSFNEYFKMHEEMVDAGLYPSFGGQTWSEHNRRVLSGKVLIELGNGIGGRHELTDEQLWKLTESMHRFMEQGQSSHRGFKL